MATSAQLIKLMKSGWTICREQSGYEVKHSPRYKGDRLPWVYQEGHHYYRYSAGDVVAVAPKPEAKPECGAQLKDPATGRIGHCIKPKGHHNVTGSRDGWTGRLHQINEEDSVTDNSTVEGTFHTYLKVTPEVIKALAFLRQLTHTIEVQFAVAELDNAGVFSAIDEVTDYDTDPEPVLVRKSKCTCPDMRHGGRHWANCPGDPAEWGDMAYTYTPRPTGFERNQMAAEQSKTVQCDHCRGDYKPKADGTLRKHDCWAYDGTTIVWGPLDIHERKN